MNIDNAQLIEEYEIGKLSTVVAQLQEQNKLLKEETEKIEQQNVAIGKQYNEAVERMQDIVKSYETKKAQLDVASFELENARKQINDSTLIIANLREEIRVAEISLVQANTQKADIENRLSNRELEVIQKEKRQMLMLGELQSLQRELELKQEALNAKEKALAIRMK
jgi:chromosome segregation ATPase